MVMSVILCGEYSITVVTNPSDLTSHADKLVYFSYILVNS